VGGGRRGVGYAYGGFLVEVRIALGRSRSYEILGYGKEYLGSEK
jgi:hypothetical protein